MYTLKKIRNYIIEIKKYSKYYDRIGISKRREFIMIISESKKDSYLTEITNDETLIFSDVAKEKGGSGKHFKPYDLLCSGYASCLNITTRMVLERMNVKYDKVIVKINLKNDDPDNAIFEYDIDIIGDIDDETKAAVIAKAEKCPVRKTLSKNIEFQKMKNV
jgi:putative redox protein